MPYSRSFNSTELNYDVHDKELFAIYEAFRIWRHYLDGLSLLIDVVTDHKNLEYFSTVKNTKRHAQSKSVSENNGSDWVKDPRMPHELNELTSLIWKSQLKEPAIEQYRHPESDKMSDPVDFVTYLRPKEQIKKIKRTERLFRLPTIDESMASIERLKEKYKPICKQVRKQRENQ